MKSVRGRFIVKGVRTLLETRVIHFSPVQRFGNTGGELGGWSQRNGEQQIWIFFWKIWERERERGGGRFTECTANFMKIGLEIHNISKYIVCFSRSMAVRSIFVAGLVVFLIKCSGAVIRLEDVCRVEEGRCDWKGEGVYRGCIDSPAVTFYYFRVGWGFLIWDVPLLMWCSLKIRI